VPGRARRAAEVVDQHLAVDLRGVQRGAPCHSSSVSSLSPSTSTSTSLPTHAAFALALIFCCSFISLRRRTSIVRFGTFSARSSEKDAAPSSSEYPKTPSQSIFAAATNSQSWLKSSASRREIQR